MVAHFILSPELAPRLVKLSLLVGVALSCSSTKDYFSEPANLASAHAGASAGAKASAGEAGVSGTEAGVGGSSGRGGGGSVGGSSVGGQVAVGGSQQGGSSGTTPSAGASTAGSPSSGGDGVGGSGAVGGNSNGGEGGGDGGAGGDNGVAGEPGSGGTGGSPCLDEAERCDGVSNDCDELVDEGGVCQTGCEAKVNGGHLYLLCLFEDADDQLDYAEATMACANAKATSHLDVELELARLDSAPENTFIKAWIDARATGEGAVWHGANDLDQERRWVWGREPNEVQFFTESLSGGGQPYMGRFEDWGNQRPNASNGANEDCGGYDSELAWKWNDLQCSVPRLGFVCEEAP